MKNMNKKALLLGSAGIVLASLLALGVKSVFAAGSLPSGTLSAGAKPRVNNAVSMSLPLTTAAKGVKVFGADNTATLVTDEKGTAPTNGSLTSVEIGGNTVGAAVSCYLLVYDSSVATDITEAAGVSRLLVPPLYATVSGNVVKEFTYPRQFNKGLVVLTAGSGCRASITWTRNGGDN